MATYKGIRERTPQGGMLVTKDDDILSPTPSQKLWAYVARWGDRLDLEVEAKDEEAVGAMVNLMIESAVDLVEPLPVGYRSGWWLR